MIGSLALNLFFIGTIGSLAVRHYVMPAQPAATERPRTAAARIERLAAPLPAADAEKLRAAFRAREAAAEGARDALNRASSASQGRVARASRSIPQQLRAALAEVRTARPAYEQVMQEISADRRERDVARGPRNKLADWPPSRPATTTR